MAIGQTSPYSILMIILMSILLFNRANSSNVGWLVITTCSVSCPNAPSADWLAVQHALEAAVSSPTTLLAVWSSLHLPPSAASSAPQPDCWPTGHPSNIACQPPHQPHHPTVSWLVITPTPLLAGWSPLQHTLLADWSSLQPHCQPTGHHSNILQHTLLATPSSPPPHCQLAGHPSNIPCQPPISPTTPLLADWSPFQPHCQPTGHHSNPTVSWLVTPPVEDHIAKFDHNTLSYNG